MLCVSSKYSINRSVIFFKIQVAVWRARNMEHACAPHPFHTCRCYMPWKPLFLPSNLTLIPFKFPLLPPWKQAYSCEIWICILPHRYSTVGPATISTHVATGHSIYHYHFLSSRISQFETVSLLSSTPSRIVSRQCSLPAHFYVPVVAGLHPIQNVDELDISCPLAGDEVIAVAFRHHLLQSTQVAVHSSKKGS